MTYMVLADGPRGEVVNGPYPLEQALRTARSLTAKGWTQAFLSQCNTDFRLDVAEFAAGALPERRNLAGIRPPVLVAGRLAIGSLGQGTMAGVV